MQGIKLLLVIAIAVSTDVKSVQGQRVDVQPRNITSTDLKSVQGQRMDVQPRNITSTDVKSVQGQRMDVQPRNITSTDVKSVQGQRVDVQPRNITSTDVKSVQGQRVDVQPGNMTVLEGDSANIICRWRKPLQHCRIVLPDETSLILSQNYNQTPGFQYLGAGLNNGQCGVFIQSVRAAHHGTVKCKLSSDGKEHVGQIGLTVASAPQLPELLFSPSPTGSYGVGEQFRADCLSRGGRPRANLTFYLDDEPVTDGVGVESENTKLNAVQKEITRTLEASDDGRTLTCRSHHIAVRGQPQEVKMQFHIRYKPQPLPEINVTRLILGSDVLITTTIKANPRPRTEWIVEGTAIPERTQTDRYKSYEPIDLDGGGVFNVSLSIASLTLEDTTKIYKLQASNELGSQEYIVRIASSEAAGVTGGLGVEAIVSIVVGVAVLIIIVVAVIVAMRTEMCCFGGGSVTFDIE